MPILSEAAIETLVRERKPFPKGIRPPLKWSARRGHYRRDFEISAPSGNRFKVIVRQSVVNPMDFSVILGYYLPGSYTVFRLRRYNGRAHHHTNVLEKQAPFYDFHIHTATERYQDRSGYREEWYAERTARFADLAGAIDCFLDDCGFAEGLEDSPLFAGGQI